MLLYEAYLFNIIDFDIYLYEILKNSIITYLNLKKLN